MKKTHSIFFQTVMGNGFLALLFCFLATSAASAAITNPKPWSLVYGGIAYPGTYVYGIPAVKNRILVVAVSSTRSTAGTQTVTVTYGGQTLTLAAGDAGTSARQHSYLFYLNEAGLRAASTRNLVVTITGGTSLYNHVYAAVYAGVNQSTPITNARNYNSLAAANTTVGPFASALTIASNDLAVEIVNITRNDAGTARTISAWASNWSPVMGPNSAPAGPNRQTAYIAANATAGTTVSQHTADGNCWDSMCAMTLNSQVAPEFTSLHHTAVEIGQNLNFAVTADGSPAPTLSMAGSLPSGITFTPATGILSGTPDPGTEGSYALTFTAANGVSPNATQNFTLTVAPLFPINWQYRKCHVINQAPGAGTGYQVRITAHYGAGVDSGEDVYLNSACRSDFADIRFVSSDGVTALDYWMETGSLTPGVSAIFWVKVAEDLGIADRTIYIYYGHPTALTTSNGDNTFSFFDDFDNTLSKWVIEKTVSPGTITIVPASSYVRCGGGITSGYYGHTSLGSSPAYSSFTNGAIEVRLKQSTTNQPLAEIAYRGNFEANTGYKGRYDCRPGSESPHMRPPYYGWAPFGAAIPRFGLGLPIWYRGTVTITTLAGQYTHQIFRNGVLMSSATDTLYPGPGEIALQNHYGLYSDYDWVAVRKYVSPEPAHDLWCAQEPLAPNIYVTKSVALAIDADGNGVVTPGDTLRYNVKIHNTGNVIVLNAALVDNLPTQTTYTGTWTASNGTVTNPLPGQISWTGYVLADPADLTWTEITFDVTLNAGTPLGTVVSNQGTVTYDSDNDGINDTDLFTDGDPYQPGIQTTDFKVGSSPQGAGFKTASLAVDEDGNGVVTPGDTLEYTIQIINYTGFVPVAAIELTDVIPEHTIYVPGSTTVTDYEVTLPPPHAEHDPVVIEPSPTGRYPEALVIQGIDIGPVGDPPNNIVWVTFRVILDTPMAPGVTQISNQAVGFYDSNSDGINDTHQTTDGDPATVGNQPTLTDLYIGRISGTVFDDLNGNGSQDGGEPGISGVYVEVFDALWNLEFATYTNGFGNYLFEGLLPGNHWVQETDPPGYISTTPNSVSVTLANSPPTGDSQIVNFGDQMVSADMAVVKVCQPVIADGTRQLVYMITVTNNGPADATNATLTDNITAFETAGYLINIEYTEDGGAATPWPVSNTLTWPSLAIGASHVIRIYAIVPDTLTSPLPANTAQVASSLIDPVAANNSSTCAEATILTKRLALRFPQYQYCGGCNPHYEDVGDAYVTVDDIHDPGDPGSLDLTTQGTLEAWIYPQTRFVADAGVLFKGDNDPANLCYAFGFGTTSSGVFTGGSSQNIVFAIHDGTNKYVLPATDRKLDLDHWYHVACVWDTTAAKTMVIYINGVEEAYRTDSINPAQTNTEDLLFAIQTIMPAKFPGVMDEVRIWETARDVNDIRDFMCKKLTGSEPGLVGYWRFDEGSGSSCYDTSGNGNVGVIFNALRLCSEAPVGDDSVWDYTGTSPGDFTQTLSSTYGDQLTITGDAGDWNQTPDLGPPLPRYASGLQVYRVDDAPSPGSAPIGWKAFTSAPHYFGVFVTGGTGPKYEAVYHYTGYPGIVNEDQLQLAYRHNNCDTWKNANAELDTTANTLTRSGFSGTEFILGSYMDPRNCILFDGSNDYVSAADHSDLDLSTYGAIEAWVNLSAYQDNAGIIHKGDGTTDSYSLYMGSGAANNQVYFTIDSGSGTSTVSSTNTLALNTWYHLAGRWDDTADVMTLYINGVSEASGTTVSAQDSSGDLFIGVRQTGGPSYFNGYIDEVRVWNISAPANMRTQSLIRSAMCQKLSGSETDLGGYWRFDEETDSANCPDYSGNGHTAVMAVSPGFDDIRDARRCSSAPIGDASAYDYFDLGAGVSVQLTHPDGDYLFATQNTGTWTDTFSGIQLYRLDEAPVYPPDLWDFPNPPYSYQTPNGLTPPTGWSSIDYYRYWGVFVTDWINTPKTYDVVYYYGTAGSGNPSVPQDDSVLGLAKRDDYCDPTWADSGATLNTGADTLTLTGEAGTEYVLGGDDAPLAITLASFTAKVVDGCIEIFWETATEIGTLGFQLWRSTEKDGDYERVPGSFTRSAAVMEAMGAQYSFTDCDAVLDGKTLYYYKLEEIDVDNTKGNAFYGPMGPMPDATTATQPVAAKDSKDKVCFISILLDD